MVQLELEVVVAGMGLLLAVVLAVLWTREGMGRAPGFWSAASLLVGLAGLGIATPLALPKWQLGLLVDGSLLLALTLSVYGMRGFLVGHARGWIFGIFMLAVLGTVAALSWRNPSDAVGTLVLCALMVYLALDVAWVAMASVRRVADVGRVPLTFLAVGALVSAALAVLRAHDVARAIDGTGYLASAIAGEAMLRNVQGLGLIVLFLGFIGLGMSRLRWLRERRATFDPLTGTLSRDAFLRTLDQACEQAERTRQSLVLFTVALDHLPEIVEVYGKPEGDKVLRHFSGLVRRDLREGDSAGRVGEAEFAVLMPSTDLKMGKALAFRLSSVVRGTPCPSEPDPIHYTISLGIADRGAGETGEALWRRTDRILPHADSGERQSGGSDDGDGRLAAGMV